MSQEKINKILEVIESHGAFTVGCHVNPEGDSLGSMLALAAFIERQGKKAVCYCKDPVPHILKFLPGSEKIIHATGELGNQEAVLVVDCSDLARTGDEFASYSSKFKKRAQGPLVNIDHHGTSDYFGDINLVEPEASSTCEIIYNILKASGREIPLDVAVCLYTGLVHDTGSFQYLNTTAKTLEAGAELVRLGVEPAHVCGNLYENQPRSKLKLLAMALATLRFEDNGRRAEMLVSREMFKAAEAKEEATEGFINHLNAIQGVDVAMTFREQAPNKYKVSFRSHEKVDVGKIAESLGGGGHSRASGATIEGTLDEARKKVHDAIDMFAPKS